MSDQNAPAQVRTFEESKMVNPKVEVAFSIYESKTTANGVDPEIVESRRLGPFERTLLVCRPMLYYQANGRRDAMLLNN